MITSKECRIWMVLLDSPNQWIDMQEIGFLTGMTSKQASSIINHMSTDMIQKGHNMDGGLQAMLEIAPEDIQCTRSNILRECHGITDEMERNVINSLSTVGWFSVMDVCDLTGYRKNDVMTILRTSDDILKKTANSSTLYMKKESA